MAELLTWVSSYYPGLVVPAIILLLFIDKSGLIQSLAARGEKRREGAREAQRHEDDRISEERDRFITGLHEELDEVRKRHATDVQYFIGELARVRAELDEKNKQLSLAHESIMTLIRGESRFRHAFMNLCAAFASLRAFCRRNNLQPLPYDGWRDLMNTDPNLDQRLREWFIEQEQLNAPPPEQSS